MFELFNLPKESIFDIKVPAKTFYAKSGLASEKFAEVYSAINDCLVHAILRKDTFDISCTENEDSYYNEILFLIVNISDVAKCEDIAKLILMAFPYQSVVMFENNDKYCIATGLVRDAKKRLGARTIDEYCISLWHEKNQTDEMIAFDLDFMKKNSFSSIYESIHAANKEMNDKYLTLTFVSKLYSYVHGDKFDLPDNINIKSRIKEMCPQNKYTNNKGAEIYRFSEEEVYVLIYRTGGYGDGETLAEIIYNFVEYEDDFNITLPSRLQNQVADCGIDWSEVEPLIFGEKDESDDSRFYEENTYYDEIEKSFKDIAYIGEEYDYDDGN